VLHNDDWCLEGDVQQQSYSSISLTDEEHEYFFWEYFLAFGFFETRSQPAKHSKKDDKLQMHQQYTEISAQLK
jgi:hypothetical protein